MLFEFDAHNYSVTMVDGESVLYPNDDDETLSIVSLNSTATIVLQGIIAGCTVSEMTQGLSDLFSISTTLAELDLQECIDELLKLQVVHYV